MAGKTPRKKRVEKIYAFIDSQNLNVSVKNQGWKLDFSRFRVYLRDKYSVGKCYLFVGYVPKYQNLYKKLRKDGYLLVFKPTLKVKDKRENTYKGNVDAELVLHTMIEFPNYDKAVIVSGDGDFHCLVKYLRRKDKLMKIVIPDIHSYSSLYRNFWNYLAFVNYLREKLEERK